MAAAHEKVVDGGRLKRAVKGMAPVQPQTPRERLIAKGFSGATWHKAIRLMRRVAAGVDPRASRELDRQFVAIAEELLRDVAREAAVRDRRAARKEVKRDGRVSRNAQIQLDNGWTVNVAVPRTVSWRHSRRKH